MSEQIHDQVSAFMDDELSPEECAFLVRRLERDPEARNKLVRYSLIGPSLRNELTIDPDMLRRRVNDALNGETREAKVAVAATAASPPVRQKWVNPAFGVGIAATVAIASLFVIRTVNDFGVPVDRVEALNAASLEAPSYVVPRQAQDSRVVAAPPIRLTNYLMRHGEYASHLSRTSVQSNVVAGMDGPAIIEAVATPNPSSNPTSNVIPASGTATSERELR